ncbi:MAG: AbrB family transcriptional regulator [Pseudomonadota bacterium]
MIGGKAGRVALTLLLGLGGAAVATLLGLPAAALIGAALVTSIAAWSGATLAMDTRLRDAGFLVIGLSLGSGFDGGVLGEAGTFALSLGALCLSVLLTLGLGVWLLRTVFRYDTDTAVLASSPGTMSLALSIAAEGRGRAEDILVMQSMRLLVIAAVLPLSLRGFGGTPFEIEPGPVFGLPALVILAALGVGAALVLKRTAFPAAYLLGGMAVSAVAHVTGLVHGYPPDWLLFAGFTITGSVIGSRFTGIGIRRLLRHTGATAVVVGTAIGVSAVAAVLVSQALNLPLGQVWIAFAPGGVEAMAAIGLALGYDPAYVALHHLVRISLLALLIPFLTKSRRTPPPQ